MLILGSKEIETINNSDIYDTYRDLYLSTKEHGEKLLQVIQSVNGLQARVGAKNSDGTARTMMTQENAIKKTFDRRFAIPLDFDFFKHPVYPSSLKEDLTVKLELNSSEKVFLCTGDTSPTYKHLDILLEYDLIYDIPYATSIGEMYVNVDPTHQSNIDPLSGTV